MQLQYGQGLEGLDSDIVAIFVKDYAGVKDVYGRYEDSFINGGFHFNGIGKINCEYGDTGEFVIMYVLNYEDDDYFICIDNIL